MAGTGRCVSDVLLGISNLFAKSLVTLERLLSPCWLMLETIRVYGLEKHCGVQGSQQRSISARPILSLPFRLGCTFVLANVGH